MSNHGYVLHVHVEGTASVEEVASIQRHFEDAGIRAEVDATYGIGGDIPELAIWILVISPIWKFANELGASAAKRRVDTIWESRSFQTGSDGVLIVSDSRYPLDADFSATLEPGLPTAAYADLQVLASKLRRGKLAYDHHLGGWVVDNEQLLYEIESLHAERRQLLAERSKKSWRFWKR